MKRFTLVFCLFILFTATGCIKDLLKDKDEETKPTDKYAGTWNLTAGAADVNRNGVIDVNERVAPRGASQINLGKDLSFTYSSSMDGRTEIMSGKWTLNADGKSITISDNSSAVRFDIQSDKELHSQPIPSGGMTYWLIYTR